MTIDRNLLNEFVKVTNDNKNSKKEEPQLYGTVVNKSGSRYVKIDGSDILTPVHTTTDINDNERVMVTIKNHRATVTGNLSNPSAGGDRVNSIEGKIDTYDHLFAGNITAENIAANSITSDKILAGSITTDKLMVDAVTANKIKANSIESKHISAKAITADKIDAGAVTADKIDAGAVTADKIEAGAITAGSGIISDGAIGNAQISNIDASKIDAGVVNTSKVTIQGKDGHLRIKDNRIQVFNGIGDQAKERVSVGDVNGDGTVYGFRVRGADGKTVLLDENGVKSEGITDGSITNSKISDTADIDAAKINIQSVVNKINEDGTGTIKGSKISVDDTTLDAKLYVIDMANDAQGKTITEHSSKIEANEKAIKLKVDSQTYQNDKTNMTSQLNKNTSAINILEEEIKLKVEQTDITNAIDGIELGCTNLLLNTDFNQVVKVNQETTKNPNSYPYLWNGYNSGIENPTQNYHAHIDTDTFGYNVVEFNESDGTKHWKGIQQAITGLITKFDKYILSLDTYATSSGAKIFGGFYYYKKGSNNASFHSGQFTITNISVGKWGRCSIQVPLNDDIDFSKHISFYIYSYGFSSNAICYIKNVKLETGDKATDWSPSPKDVNDKIDSIDDKVTTINSKVSDIEIGLDGITSKVESVETKTTTLENTTEKKLINNFSLSGNMNMWQKPHGIITSNSVVGNYMKSTLNNQNISYMTEPIEIDPTKTYKTSLMVQMPSTSGDCTFFYGIYAYDKDNSNIGVYVGTGTTLNINPYFINLRSNKFTKDRWYTYESYIYGHTTKTDANSPKGNCSTYFKFDMKTKYIIIRFLHYRSGTYGDGGQGDVYFAHPTITEVDNQIVNTETRLKSAESKITDSAIVNTVKNHQTNGKNTFAQTSQVQQTVDELKVKFEESGGYNILFNGDFKRGTEFWTSTTGMEVVPPSGVGNGMGSENGLDIRLHGGTDKAYFFTQLITDKEYLNYKQYTISANILLSFDAETVSGAGIKMFSRVTYSDKTIEYFHSNLDNSLVEQWQRPFVTFSPNPNKQVTEIAFTISLNKSNKYVYVSQAMIEKGSTVSAWSPHPNELVQGITTIDKNGIKVESSASNNFTVMDSSSFRVEDHKGGTIAEFSSVSRIPTLNSGIINAEEIYANNLVTKSEHTGLGGDFKTYYVDGALGSDSSGQGNGPGSSAFRTVQYVVDNYIDDIVNRHILIVISKSVQGWYCSGISGRGVIKFELYDDCIVNGTIVIDGCQNKIIIQGTTNIKGTLKNGINVMRSSYVDIGWLTFRGANWPQGNRSCNVYLNEGSTVIVRFCDFNGADDCIQTANATQLWVYGNRGSNVSNYIGLGPYATVYTKITGHTDDCPDYTGYLYSDNGHAGIYRIHDGCTWNKVPSVGWNPSYTPTQKTQTWDFNVIWSDETLNGWPSKNELIQGYASVWNTGRWTGYMQMNDNMNAIKNTISGGTNLSGRIYIQRTTSSGNSTGSKLNLFASDGTAITTTTTINRGQGVWVSLSSSIISKIQSGAITYFYLKADSNNTATYFKCESNAKIEITYTK